MRPPEGLEELKEAPPRKATLLEDLVALLPLSSGEDIRRFEAKLDRLTSRRGAAMARDAEDRGLLWHAVSRGDAIATQCLMDRKGYTLEILAPTSRGCGASPYEVAVSSNNRRIISVLKENLAPELDAVSDLPPLLSSSNSNLNLLSLEDDEARYAAAAEPSVTVTVSVTVPSACCWCCPSCCDDRGRAAASE